MRGLTARSTSSSTNNSSSHNSTSPPQPTYKITTPRLLSMFGKKNSKDKEKEIPKPKFDMPPPPTPSYREVRASWRAERLRASLRLSSKAGLTQIQVDEYKKAFDHFDADGSGDLTFDEIRHVLTTQGVDVSKSEVDELIQDIDIDGNGTIDFPEFLAAMARRAASKAHIQRLQRTVQRVITLQKHTFPTFLPLQANDPRYEIAEAQRQKTVDKIIQQHTAQQDDLMKRSASATILQSKSKAVMGRRGVTDNKLKPFPSEAFHSMIPDDARESTSFEQLLQGEPASISKLLKTTPISKCTEEPPVTTYSAFDAQNIRLFCPITPELVSQIPQPFCLQCDANTRNISVIDQHFQPLKALTHQPEHSTEQTATYFCTVTIPASCTKVYLCSRGHVNDRVKYEVYCHFDIVDLIEFSANHTTPEKAKRDMKACFENRNYKNAIHHAQICLYFDARDCEALECELLCHSEAANHKLAVETADVLLGMSKSVLSQTHSIRKRAFEVRAVSSFVRGFAEQCFATCTEGLMTFPDSDTLAQYQALSEIQTSCDVDPSGESPNQSLWMWVDQDAHALSTPESECSTVLELATYLARPFTKEIDKVRAFFRWICENIEYDGDGLRYGTFAEADISPEGVVQIRKAVCQGYVNLFKAMCDAVQCCECVVLLGFGKSGFLDIGEMQVPNHAWNAFRIDNMWHLVDVTWAAGTLQPDFTFRKDFNNYFWMTPPHQFILSHFPENPAFQLLGQLPCDKAGEDPTSSSTPLTKADFAASLTLSSHVFDLGLEVISHRCAIIEAQHGETVQILIHETKHDPLFLYAQLKSLVDPVVPWDADVEYDDITKMHTITVHTKGEERGSYELGIFFSEEESGMYTGLLEYRLDVV